MFLFWPIKLAFRLISLLITAIVVYLIVSGVQVVLASRLPTSTSTLTPATAIVVLGSTESNGAPSANLLARLQEALACYQSHLASSVIVSGASGTAGSAGVSSVAANWLTSNGVPASAIQQVTAGDASAALSSAPVASAHQVIVVTDALNALWTKSTAEHDGLAVQIAPSSGSERPAYNEIDRLWNQASAVAAGRIIGFSRASWAGH